jgi:enamine deaminase RidA (YjgF/YER057c/UK114 family)
MVTSAARHRGTAASTNAAPNYQRLMVPCTQGVPTDWKEFNPIMIKHLAVLAAALMISSTASAQAIKRIPLTPSQNPTNADLPFSQAVWAGDTLYVSGWLDPDVKTHTDIKSQAVGILEDMQKFLASQKLTLGDVVMMRVYIGGDPTKDFRGDALEARAGFRQFFGTKDQPNKPACTTVHVPLPAAPRGVLVEIDVIAVRPKSSSGALADD